jgi:hypothetical protein
MKTYSLEAAPAASAKEPKTQEAPKAKRIVLGTDVHLRGYHVDKKCEQARLVSQLLV